MFWKMYDRVRPYKPRHGNNKDSVIELGVVYLITAGAAFIAAITLITALAGTGWEPRI